MRVFPDLNSSNIGYKLLLRLAAGEMIGPILVGMRRPVHILHQASEVSDIVHLAAIASTEVQALDGAGMLLAEKEDLLKNPLVQVPPS